MIRLVAFVWLGMVLGVSFLATPIKFRAESLTLPVALDVGRTTFHAFGKVEWVLAVLLTFGVARVGRVDMFVSVGWLLAGVVVAIVALQALWLIPKLDLRVAEIIGGGEPAPSHLHTVFAAIEFAKAAALLALGLLGERLAG